MIILMLIIMNNTQNVECIKLNTSYDEFEIDYYIYLCICYNQLNNHLPTHSSFFVSMVTLFLDYRRRFREEPPGSNCLLEPFILLPNPFLKRANRSDPPRVFTPPPALVFSTLSSNTGSKLPPPKPKFRLLSLTFLLKVPN